MKDIVASVTMVSRDGRQVQTVKGGDMDFGYRHSCLEESGSVVTEVTLKLTPGDHEEIAAKMKELTRRRNEKQPVQYPSAAAFSSGRKGISPES